LFSLTKDLHQKACILFFYSRDFNTSCTQEACEFKNKYAEFKKYGVEVMGISRDDIATHLEFKSRYDLPFELLSDTGGEVSQMYEALFPVFRFSKRVTYLLDKQQRILSIYENMFEPKRHAQYMLEKVKGLQPTNLSL
jgi:peroxiredoxin Q/BCP